MHTPAVRIAAPQNGWLAEARLPPGTAVPCAQVRARLLKFGRLVRDSRQLVRVQA